MRRLLPLLLAACPHGGDPPTTAPKLDDNALLVHPWKVSGHVLSAAAVMSDTDADALTGRIVEITPTGYTSPWHGTCESATRERRSKSLVEVTTAERVSETDRARLTSLGFTADLVEYRLSCRDNLRAPELALWIADKHMLTCWNGVCYVLGY